VPARPTAAQVYRRVFLSEQGAATWCRWNLLRGDPAMPYHTQRVLAGLGQEVRQLQAAGLLLDAHKLLLLAADIAQDPEGLFQFSRWAGCLVCAEPPSTA
jgi:hypothetical protein